MFFMVLLLLQSVTAQFQGFFDQMFGHPHQQQQQRPSGASYYNAQVDASV
jgi:hypothetical protein